MKALVAPILNGLYPLLLRTPESSAEAMLIAATAPAGKVAGRYMHNDRLSRPDKVGAGFATAKASCAMDLCEVAGSEVAHRCCCCHCGRCAHAALAVLYTASFMLQVLTPHV